MKITISESILNKLANFDIIAMSMDVTYQETNVKRFFNNNARQFHKFVR